MHAGNRKGSPNDASSKLVNMAAKLDRATHVCYEKHKRTDRAREKFACRFCAVVELAER